MVIAIAFWNYVAKIKPEPWFSVLLQLEAEAEKIDLITYKKLIMMSILD